jgi:uncharacterized protein YegL
MGEPRDTHLENALVEGPDWGAELLDLDLDLVENVELDLDLAESVEPRCLCLLLLDTSAPMAGEPIAALNHGLEVLSQELLQLPLARKRVEVSIVTFGAGVELVQDFIPADRFRPALLPARGETPLGAAILFGLDHLESRTANYQLHEVPYSRPWVVLITDGMPQGEPLETTRLAIQRIRKVEAAGQAVFFAVGVEGANMPLLARIAVRPPVKLRKLCFANLFTWLSASIACGADPGEGPWPPGDWGTT